MPLDVGRFPLGLSGLLNLRTGGKTPSVLADTVASVIDTTQQFALGNWESLIMQVAVPALGTQNLIGLTSGVQEIVPPGESWYIHGFRGQGGIAVATAMRYLLGIRPQGSAAGPIYFGEPQSFVAGEQAFVTADAAQGLWIPPGTAFVVGVVGITGAPGGIIAELWFSRFKQ